MAIHETNNSTSLINTTRFFEKMLSSFVISYHSVIKISFTNKKSSLRLYPGGFLPSKDYPFFYCVLDMGSTLAIKDSVDESLRRMDLKTLCPIFAETLTQPDFLMSKMIRVVDRDKKYIDSDVCQGSIGYYSNKAGLHIINLFKDSLSEFGLSFYPDNDCEFYYVNPTDRDNYISLVEYFGYLKMVRVNELQRVAQDLGAKHFKVTFKEEQISFAESKAKAQAKVQKKGAIEAQNENSEKKYSFVEVEAEMYMDGHEPIEPKLVYLEKDDNVKNLIHLRMTGGQGFHSHKISIKMINTLGIKERDAVKIDSALKELKVAGNASFASEVKNESRRYLEYEIDF